MGHSYEEAAGGTVVLDYGVCGSRHRFVHKQGNPFTPSEACHLPLYTPVYLVLDTFQAARFSAG